MRALLLRHVSVANVSPGNLAEARVQAADFSVLPTRVPSAAGCVPFVIAKGQTDSQGGGLGRAVAQSNGCIRIDVATPQMQEKQKYTQLGFEAKMPH